MSEERRVSVLDDDSSSVASSRSTTMRRKCRQCTKSFASKYNLDRHVVQQHKNSNKRKNVCSSEEDEKDEKEEEPTNHIWRQMIKRILRKWNNNDDEKTPQSKQQYIDVKDDIRANLFEQLGRIMNDYAELVNSPLYEKIKRTKDRFVYDIDSSDDEGEGLKMALDYRKILLNDFIEANADAWECFNESSDEETDDEE